ncbi:PEGA domain-containing protein [Thermococcus aciditolerans]|uniref:PEGA domain-containing protein n=1 Tax=Thermococcus aciditolerans TaxID=2598455 RepID=A0A5C0SNI9_9EURY|nr:PEGA domain-containing protein [Thermococcus aciditolerans]QEK15306.1 PEGA domain-containing protein [Thermococcus aciditolerans]
MRWKVIFLAFLVAGLLVPPAYSAGESAMERPGYLFVEAPGTVAEIVGIGSYATPVGLVLKPGNYTIRIPGNVTVAARVSVVAETATIIRVNPEEIEEAVSGEGIVSVRAIFNESANYSREKLNPPFNPLQKITGCGFGSLHINISRPVPMALVERGEEEVYLIPNGTFVHLGDSEGKPCIDYVETYGGSIHAESVRNATYLVPWARLEITSVPKDLTFYINGGHNIYIFYTPMGIYVPAIPHDVYNATAVGYYGTIRIPVIHRLDTHVVGIAENHYLIESVVKVAPNETYHINVDMEKVKSALTVEREAVRAVPLEVDSEPGNASTVVTDGVLRVFATTPATLFLPPGNYTVIASRDNLSARESVVLTESASAFLKLSPANATLHVVTYPGNATVLLNGEEVKAKNLTLSPGCYNITVEAPGYLTKSVEVILAPNESKTVEVSLEENPSVEDPEITISPPSGGSDDMKSGEMTETDEKDTPGDTQTPPAPPVDDVPGPPGRDSGSLWAKLAILAGVVAAVYLVLRVRR